MTVKLTDLEVNRILDRLGKIDTYMVMLAKIEVKENGTSRCPLSDMVTSQLNIIGNMLYGKLVD